MAGRRKRAAPSTIVTPRTSKRCPRVKVKMEKGLDSMPEMGTAQSVAAHFTKEHTNALYQAPLTADEKIQIEKEMEKIGLPKAVAASKKLAKTPEKKKNLRLESGTLINKNSKKPDVFEEAQELFQEAERLLSGIHDPEEIVLGDSDNDSQNTEVIELDIESDPDTDTQEVHIVERSEDEEEDLGVMKMFQVAFYGASYMELPLRAYDLESIRTVREQVAKKANMAQADNIQLFLESSILEDSQNVRESGIFTGCVVDGFIIEKSLQEVHETGSGAVLKLKLQTEDRRGRQNRHIYIRKTETIKILRNRYAADVNMVAETLQLMSEGEVLDLESTVEDCDLEDEYLVDVIISPA